ncbi:MAG: preprotein translocase subunit SecG [Coriobacteriia bacterium]|nr:preprotein translocase subunit SecG [Coriobacteriia bacterium]
MSALFIIFLIIWAISSIGLIVLVLMHSGKGAGLSETFGGSMDPNLGTGVIEKNLNRITIVCASIFILTLLVMMFIWPSPYTAESDDLALQELEDAGIEITGGEGDDTINIDQLDDEPGLFDPDTADTGADAEGPAPSNTNGTDTQ